MMKTLGKMSLIMAAASLTLGLFSAAAFPFLPGEREVRALAEAYPDRIQAREPREGQWALRIGEHWYSWAEGRMLPEEERDRWEEFVPIRFYTYKRGPWSRPEPSPQQLEALKARNQAGNTDSRPRSDAFLDKLYGISSAAEAEKRMVERSFLGKRVRVHSLLTEPLGRVEGRIRAAEAQDSDLRTFVATLAQIQGFHWREIAGTARRSYHSYGSAIDIIPRSYLGRYAYWRWAFDAGVEEWWSLPENKIWQVPAAFIDAFESEGFVWGGKWLWFDRIHFEYRPEVLRLAD
ncbi:hypothetical protein MASR2M48_15050 [Spirochaetota bacterium]